LDVEGVSVDKGANVIQWECNGDDNQQFKLNEVAHQIFEVQAVHSKQCLDVFGASQTDKANVIQWPCNSDENQYWKIDDLGSSTGRLTIAGVPKTVAYYYETSTNNPSAGGIEYQFKPRVNRLSNIKFSISNMPEWASFDVNTGLLSGIPLPNDSGHYANINISVSMGNESSALSSFNIEVLPWRNKSFCSAKGKTDGKTYCGLIVENLADASQCSLWTQHHWPLLNNFSIRLNTASNDENIRSIVNSKCDEKEQEYDETTGSCPIGYKTVSQGVFSPRCMKKMSNEELVKKIGQMMEGKYLNYEKERKKYSQRSDALAGFEPRKPIVSGPDGNGHVEITLPPPIDLQHDIEKKKREIEAFLKNVAKGLQYQDPDVNIDLCPEIEGGSGWNKGVCFDWNKDLGDKKSFSINAEAMGMLRASGESAGQFTLTAYVFRRAINLMNVNEQTQIWTIPENVGKKYLTMKRNSARESLKKITKEIDSISNSFETLTNAVSGSSMKAEITTFASIVDKKYKEVKQGNENFSFRGKQFSRNATLNKFR
jgi:hypothetical protein